jgi:hypothetical protein
MTNSAWTPPSRPPSGLYLNRGDGHLGIHGRAASPRCRLDVAADAAVQVEARAETLADPLRFLELVLPRVEELHLSVGQARQRASGAGRAAPQAGVPGPEELRGQQLDGSEHRQGRDRRDDEPLTSHADLRFST